MSKTTTLEDRFIGTIIASLFLTLTPYLWFLYGWNLSFDKAITGTCLMVTMFAAIDYTLLYRDQIKKEIHFLNLTIIIDILICFSAACFVSLWFLAGVLPAMFIIFWQILDKDEISKKIPLNTYAAFNLTLQSVILGAIFYFTAAIQNTQP